MQPEQCAVFSTWQIWKDKLRFFSSVKNWKSGFFFFLASPGGKNRKGFFLVENIPACAIELVRNKLKVVRILQPVLAICRLHHPREAHHWSSSHSVPYHTALHPTAGLQHEIIHCSYIELEATVGFAGILCSKGCHLPVHQFSFCFLVLVKIVWQMNKEHWTLHNKRLTSRALHPLLVDATRHPSVVAIGTWYLLPSSSSGPATPTGTGM